MSVGTIQPARFLSHTGRVLPGVRRVVQVPSPAAGADWSVTVPGGVQWRILSGLSTLATSVTVGHRYPDAKVSVDGEQVYGITANGGIDESATIVYAIVTDPNTAGAWNGSATNLYAYPFTFFPQQAQIGVTTSNLDVADQWSNIVLWIEEVYETDQQLTQRELDKETVERAYLADLLQQFAQRGGGA